MLVFSRSAGQSVVIGGGIDVKILTVDGIGRVVRFEFTVPQGIEIERSDGIHLKGKTENGLTKMVSYAQTDQTFNIGSDIKILIGKFEISRSVMVGFEAPRSIQILRGELVERPGQLERL